MPARWAEAFFGLQRAFGPCPAGLCPSGLPTLAAEGSGGRGKSAPCPHSRRLGSLRERQGAESSPLRVCGPHQPLDPHSIRSGRGSRFAQRPRSGPDLDALERPQRSWLVVRGALPLTACHVANGQAPLGGRVSGGSKAKPRRLLGLGPNDLCEAKSSEYTSNEVAQRS